MSKISVIIPTFNRLEQLKRALESVYSQTLSAGEVIIVDDGSTDNTQQYIETYYPNTIKLYQTNKGVSAARNLGIKHARGQWLAFLDSDDQWLPNKLEAQFAAVTDSPQYKIVHCDEIWIRDGKRVNPMRKHRKRGGHIFKYCLPLCCISPSSVLLHHSIFDQCGVFDETLPACEDYDLWLRICSQYPVLYLDESLIIKYGGHTDQLSRKYWGMDRFRIKALNKIIRSGLLNSDDHRAALEMLEYKTRIYINGARKRGKWEEVSKYITDFTTDTIST